MDEKLLHMKVIVYLMFISICFVKVDLVTDHNDWKLENEKDEMLVYTRISQNSNI